MSDKSNPYDIGAMWTPNGYVTTGKGVTSHSSAFVGGSTGMGGGEITVDEMSDDTFRRMASQTTTELFAALAEAQAEIERLQAEIERLRGGAALRYVALPYEGFAEYECRCGNVDFADVHNEQPEKCSKCGSLFFRFRRVDPARGRDTDEWRELEWRNAIDTFYKAKI